MAMNDDKMNERELSDDRSEHGAVPLPEELRAIFEALVEGRITAQQSDWLDARLIDDAQVRKHYVEYVQLHSDLIHGDLLHGDLMRGDLLHDDAARASTADSQIPSASQASGASNVAPLPLPQPGAGPSLWSSVSKFPLAIPLALICLVVFGLGLFLGGELRREVAGKTGPSIVGDNLTNDNLTNHKVANDAVTNAELAQAAGATGLAEGKVAMMPEPDRAQGPNAAASADVTAGRVSVAGDLPRELLSKPAPFATLVAANGCEWTGSTLPTLAGSRLSRGSLRLKQGRAQVGFDNGAQVFLEGPAVFYLHASDRAHLESGRLMAHVPQQAIGFTIETQTADIVDLGTEFGVEVSPAGATEVQVLEGEVELGAPRIEDLRDGPTVFGAAPRQGADLPRQKLLVGQARRLDSPPLAGWQEVAFRPDEFRRIRPQPARDLEGVWWPVLADDFDDNELNLKSWKVVTEGIPYGVPNIFEIEGSLTLVDRAHLVSVNEFDPGRLRGLRITGRWTFRTEGDVFEVLTRSDGRPGGQYGDTLNGITFAAVMERGTSRVGILGRGDCKVDLAVTDLQIHVNDVFEFEILDVPGGLSLKLWEASGTGPRAHVFTNKAPPRMERNHVVFHNRNAHRVPQFALLDNVAIEQAIRPVMLGKDGELAIAPASSGSSKSATTTVNQKSDTQESRKSP